MAALGRQFLRINDILMPETSSFEELHEHLENVFQTEDGHDLAVRIRPMKRTFNVAWEGADQTLKYNAEYFCNARTVTVTFDNATITCRARDLKESLVRYSNRYDGSKGLWDISFTLKEI